MPAVLDLTDQLALLENGDIDLKGQFVWGSNYTFLVNVISGEQSTRAVYKPTRGERPLWDFPTASLAKREVAAYQLSCTLGWDFVPPTVYRKQAPMGRGSLQLFIPHDPEYHFFNFTVQDKDRLRPVVLFDLLVNNADRKGSHLLIDSSGKLWAIDHGICFHTDDKLRTVIWDFIGTPIPGDLLSDVEKVLSALQSGGETFTHLRPYLKEVEIHAIARRAARLLKNPVFPAPQGKERPFPYPPI
jgi:uncharacterized repeat protein (TIGR03843 family)